jgi:hypothetical protein
VRPPPIAANPRLDRFALALRTAVVDGEFVDMPLSGASLPAVCCKCGSTRDLVPRSARLAYASPATYVLAFALLPLGVLFTAIALAAGQKKVTIDFPVCRDCDRHWRNANIAWVVAMLSPIPLGIVSGIMAPVSNGDGLLVGLVVFLLGLVVLPVATRFLVVKPATIVAANIDEARVRLEGFAPAARAAIGGQRGAAWPDSSGSGRLILAIAALVASGIFVIFVLMGTRRYISTAKHGRDIQEAHERCLANANERASREAFGNGGIVVSGSGAPQPPRPIRVDTSPCAALKRECTSDYNGEECQSALMSLH